MAPKGCGMSLRKLLLDPSELRAKIFEKWEDWCATTITSTEKITLTGEFQSYVVLRRPVEPAR